MKSINITSSGNLKFIASQYEYNGDINNSASSVDRQNNLNNLLSSIKSEGLQELHVEQTDFNSFVHKIKNGDLLASDNVNSYEVFSDLENYAKEMKDYEESLIENTPNDNFKIPKSWIPE